MYAKFQTNGTTFVFLGVDRAFVGLNFSVPQTIFEHLMFEVASLKYVILFGQPPAAASSMLLLRINDTQMFRSIQRGVRRPSFDK